MDQPWIWVAIGTSFAVTSGVIGWIIHLVNRLNKSENDAKEAKTTAENAAIALSAAKLETARLASDLNDFKVKVAEDYVSKGAMEHLEKSIVGAINHLTSRFDQFLGASR
jgi:hypothetical protein